ncbi:hypothetical protein [Cytobacillus firmus]|uniref:Uncharacterized protein n=1 Tax=Cytobacillus firmus TaxID=1399 RepID=A0AA46PQU3_CYTFI|nr:hypothetical protein [Cytobacillus firmus]UYG95820.1 hypothetical protein OD459_01990 [Cytobacillus firmus]
MSDIRKAYNRIYHFNSAGEIQLRQPKFYPSGDGNPPKSTDNVNKNDAVNNKKPAPSKKPGSSPFILPPPLVESKQVSRLEQRFREVDFEGKKKLRKSKNEKVKKQNDKKQVVKIPDKIKDLLTPFSPMLSWSPSLPSQFSNAASFKKAVHNESSPTFTNMEDFAQLRDLDNESASETQLSKSVEGNAHQQGKSEVKSLDRDTSELAEEFAALLEESSSVQKQPANLQKSDESSALENEFYILLDDETESHDEKQENIYQMEEFSSGPGRYSEMNSLPPSGKDFDSELEESSSIEKDFDSELKESPSIEKDFDSELEESSSTEKDMSYPIQDEAFALLMESSMGRIEDSSNIKEEDLTESSEPSSLEDKTAMDPDNLTITIEEESSPKEKEFQREECHADSKESSTYEENFEGEYSALLKRAYFMLDDQEDAGHSLQDKFLALMDSSPSIYEEFSEILPEYYPESEDVQEKEHYQKLSLLLKEFSAKLENVNEDESITADSEEDVSSIKVESDEKFTLGSESSSKPESYEDVPGELDEESSLEEHDESSSLSEDAEECADEMNETPSIRHHAFPKCSGPIVKLPILVAKTNLEISIFDILPLDIPTNAVRKLEWSVHSLNCRVVLPSNIVFIKGILIAEIDYLEDNCVQLQKLIVPYEKITELAWCSTPVMPEQTMTQEYLFQTENKYEVHSESFQKYSEDIYCQLQSTTAVWHDELASEINLEIQGQVILSIDFLQEQYVHLDYH